jgi:hypothetical protein
MTYKSTEKEIIKAIVKYSEKSNSLADVINKSHLFEKRGVAIVRKDGNNIVYLRNDKYDMESEHIGLGYIAEFLSLVDTLIKQRHLVMIPCQKSNTFVYGAEQNKWLQLDELLVNQNERIRFGWQEGWYNAAGQQIYWSQTFTDNELYIGNKFNLAFSISQELKDLVKNKFKNEEEIRFEKQQRLTWISIIVAGIIGLASFVIGVIGLYIR